MHCRQSTKQNSGYPKMQAILSKHHKPKLSANQCSSYLVQTIDAPLPLVWSVVRRFDNPQGHKQFARKCAMLNGDGGVGSVREVVVMSGLPAAVSIERLDELDDDMHVMKFSIISGDHRLVNYRSTTTLHEDEDGRRAKTVVIESYVVDIPAKEAGRILALLPTPLSVAISSLWLRSLNRWFVSLIKP